MHGFDVNRFVQERTPSWTRLEQLLRRVENTGMRALDFAATRELSKLYRAVCRDLIRARTEQVNASVVDYLNDVVARAYAVVHTAPLSTERRVLDFLLRGFPRLFRAEWRAIALAAGILFAGGVVGAAFVGADPHSLGALIPDGHQKLTPTERVGHDQNANNAARSDQALAFSGWLFTHNIQVSFAVFALGITYGLGSVALLFYNGVPLGALAMQYHQSNLGTFFWAWVLPHGIPELTVVSIAGGAGLVMARGLWLPGRRRRRDALVAEATRAAALVLGGMPLLVLAGMIEGTISQVHAPTLPYPAKLAFAAAVGAGVYYYLLRAGRDQAGAVPPNAPPRSAGAVPPNAPASPS